MKRALISLGLAAVGVAMLVYGGQVLASGVPYTYEVSSYTGSWGILPAFIGLVIVCVFVIVLWDEVSD